jgi:hypothetical protein
MYVNELLETALDSYVKIIVLAAACLGIISEQEDDMSTEL